MASAVWEIPCVSGTPALELEANPVKPSAGNKEVSVREKCLREMVWGLSIRMDPFDLVETAAKCVFTAVCKIKQLCLILFIAGLPCECQAKSRIFRRARTNWI